MYDFVLGFLKNLDGMARAFMWFFCGEIGGVCKNCRNWWTLREPAKTCDLMGAGGLTPPSLCSNKASCTECKILCPHVHVRQREPYLRSFVAIFIGKLDKCAFVIIHWAFSELMCFYLVLLWLHWASRWHYILRGIINIIFPQQQSILDPV